MKNKLVETYQKRVDLAEEVYKSTHEGAGMSDAKKLLVATMLNNTNRFLTESFNNSVGTQRADLGMYKRFCLNLVNVSIPTLIAPELVITHPMTSITGVIAYVKYTLGSNKGGVKQGDVIADPFHTEKMSEDRINYTGAAVAEECTVDGNGKVFLAWTPIWDGFEPQLVGAESGATITVVDAKTGECAVTGATGKVKVKYCYDNVVIPQNDLPILNAEMASIGLVAKARRIAVYYSQIAAFQAKQDYGFSLEDQLAEKACGELSYEIDTEVVALLDKLAGKATNDTRFNEHVPYGVSMEQHFESFMKKIEKAKQIVYDRTQKFAPNYMVCSSSVATILPFLKGWKAASTGKINGPYLAGTLNGIKVFVSPAVAAGRFFLGVNGDDMMSSAAVYAPYMPIVPTQLLGYADGANSKGFSTMYALEPLNDKLLVAGEVYDEEYVIQTHQN